MTRQRILLAAELLCFGSIAVGLYWAWPPLGFIMGGAIGLLLLLGVKE